MSHRTSRLSTLLRVRRIQEEIRRGRLAADMAAERGTHTALMQSHERYAAQPAEPLLDPDSTQGFVAQRFHRIALAGAVRAAVACVDDAAHVTVLARHDWSESAIRMAALERLDERAREEARKERLSAEQSASEESSSARRERRPRKKARGERR